MKRTLTIDLLRQLAIEPPLRVVDIYDTHQPRLVLRVRPSGKSTYRVVLGRGAWYSLGTPDAIPSPALARKLAQARLGDYASGRDPRIEKRREHERTVEEYLTAIYAPWLTTHRRRGPETVARLKVILKERLGALALSALNAWEVERWRTERRKQGRTAATINRDVAALRAMLGRAVEWGHLAQHPLRAVKALREDKTARLRYLSADEEKRLRHALEMRDRTRRAERASANEWRRARGYDVWPSMVNTGSPATDGDSGARHGHALW